MFLATLAALVILTSNIGCHSSPLPEEEKVDVRTLTGVSQEEILAQNANAEVEQALIPKLQGNSAFLSSDSRHYQTGNYAPQGAYIQQLEPEKPIHISEPVGHYQKPVPVDHISHSNHHKPQLSGVVILEKPSHGHEHVIVHKEKPHISQGVVVFEKPVHHHHHHHHHHHQKPQHELVSGSDLSGILIANKKPHHHHHELVSNGGLIAEKPSHGSSVLIANQRPGLVAGINYVDKPVHTGNPYFLGSSHSSGGTSYNG